MSVYTNRQTLTGNGGDTLWILRLDHAAKTFTYSGFLQLGPGEVSDDYAGEMHSRIAQGQFDENEKELVLKKTMISVWKYRNFTPEERDRIEREEREKRDRELTRKKA